MAVRAPDSGRWAVGAVDASIVRRWIAAAPGCAGDLHVNGVTETGSTLRSNTCPMNLVGGPVGPDDRLAGLILA